ncbi:carbohydrate ABC transporter permease [Alicyclobacillus fastidiosus]|uniref:Carbohydrate ABC transporter permease n=1 Tax=Alicyclobacillus fastidiosus TaxID=392011 RepID=A0ABY6ZP23_9BACL|nr:carbohydrate ABC transporter permease [Alicyclobacillus fastidiosus]WAH44738.1 carbohydrate ABC transporter permease [Alicyclobacillus fastidiosus]
MGQPALETASQRSRAWGKVFKRTVLPHLPLILIGLLFLTPFVWLVITSLETNQEIFSPHPTVIPSKVIWSNYPRAIENFPFFRYTYNTLYICFFSIVGSLFSCPLVAYSFARMRYRGRNILFYIMLATMILPSQVTMVPVYIMWNRLGFVNTYWPLVIPHFFGNAMYIFLLRQFFMSIPFELTEAAKIDGASDFRIFSQIIIPLAKPVIYTVALFQFLGCWSDFMGPLIYLNDPSKWTLSIGLQSFIGDHNVEWGLLMAASTLFTLPIIVIYFFVQRKFIQGITLTGLK